MTKCIHSDPRMNDKKTQYAGQSKNENGAGSTISRAITLKTAVLRYVPLSLAWIEASTFAHMQVAQI